ncbi:hypothetical protein TNCT_713891 [Trichonephila clavata]|uniref:Uncharacterized protein n=1 Tax=Trichonephila clavata TaxID=2740835 RepID=A0A8X6M4Q5_TRICU|nr:hypothetical protein TNCT_713891 [Trichonephila clavata]
MNIKVKQQIEETFSQLLHPSQAKQMVNSEYKRNFTWHDGYQATKVDVVRNAPSVRGDEESSNDSSLSQEKLSPSVGTYSKEMGHLKLAKSLEKDYLKYEFGVIHLFFSMPFALL